MPGLEAINDIVGDQVWDQLERRLPAGLENAAKKMAEVSAYFKANPISFTGNATTIKQDVDAINKLKVAQIDLQKINAAVTKNDLLAAKVAKERSIEVKNLSQAKLADAKATDIQEKAQQRKIAADLKEAESIRKKKEAQNAPITAQDSYAGASDSLPLDEAQAALSASQEQAAVTAQQAAAAQGNLRDQINQTASAANQEAQAFLNNLTAGQELIQEQLILRDQVSKVGDALKQNQKQFKEGAITESEYTAANIQLTEQLGLLNAELAITTQSIKKNSSATIAGEDSILAAKIAVQRLSTERDKLNLLTQEGTVRQRELNAQINQYNEFIRISSDNLSRQKINIGNYPTLAAELKSVRTQMERLALAGQANSTEFTVLSQRAQVLTGAMSEVAGATRVAQQAQNGFTAGVGRAFSGIRQLAQILPGIGIAGLFGVAFTAIQKVIDSIIKTTDVTKKLSDVTKEATKAATENAAQEQTNATVLYKATQNVALSYNERFIAAKKLIDIAPGIFKGLNEEAILAGRAENAYMQLTEAIKTKIAVSVNEEQAKELYKEVQRTKQIVDENSKLAGVADRIRQIQSRQIELAKSNPQTPEQARRVKLETRDLGNELQKLYKRQKDIRDLGFFDFKREGFFVGKDDQVKAINDYTSALGAFDSKANEVSKTKAELDALFGKPDKVKDTSAKALRAEMKVEDELRKAQIAAQKELSDAIRDNRSALAEENIQTNKKVYEDETNSLDVRLEAYAEYYTARQNQARFNAQKELSDIIELEKQIEKVRGEDPSHLSASDKALLLRAEGLAERRKGIEYKLASDLSEINTQSATDRLKILESYSQREIRILEDRIAATKDVESKVTSEEMLELTNRLKSHQLSWKQYQIEKGKIISESSKDSLDIEISAINQVLLTETLSEKEQEKLINKKFDLIKKRREEDQRSAEDAAKEDVSRFAKTIDDISGITDSLSSSYFNFQKNRLQGELDALDEQKEKIETNLQLQLDAINALGLSEEERLKRVSEAEATAFALSKNIDDEKRKRNLEQARFDKAQAIFNIITSTAAAVAKLLVTPPLAIAAAILGAAQLATAAAAPLPKYAKGTKGHKGGFAQVGDGYERELIQDGDKTYWSPDVPTVVYMGKGAKVTPESDIEKMAHTEAVRKLGGGVPTPESYAAVYISSFERLIGGMSNDMKTLNNTVKNKKSANINITERGMRFFTEQANNRTEYKNKNVHF